MLDMNDDFEQEDLDSLELIANKQAFKQNAAESQTFIENQNNQKNQEFQENLDFEENQEFQEELEDFEENLFNNDDKLPKKLESILSEVVQNAQEESSAGGVSECIAEIPQIIENYKKEKVIKEKVKNFFYDEAIELNEIEENSLETFFGEENNENKMEIVEKNVHIHNVLKQHMDFDEEYEDEAFEIY